MIHAPCLTHHRSSLKADAICNIESVNMRQSTMGAFFTDFFTIWWYFEWEGGVIRLVVRLLAGIIWPLDLTKLPVSHRRRPPFAYSYSTGWSCESIKEIKRKPDFAGLFAFRFQKEIRSALQSSASFLSMLTVRSFATMLGRLNFLEWRYWINHLVVDKSAHGLIVLCEHCRSGLSTWEYHLFFFFSWRQIQLLVQSARTWLLFPIAFIWCNAMVRLKDGRTSIREKLNWELHHRADFGPLHLCDPILTTVSFIFFICM